jgi:hypothetical protein
MKVLFAIPLCNLTDVPVAFQNLTLDLISAFQILPASRLLRSSGGGRNLYSDILRLNTFLTEDFDIDRVRPLLRAVINEESDELLWQKVYTAVTESTPPPRQISSILQTPLTRNTSSFANSSEHRKYIDDVLKEELGPMYVGVPGFFEAKFGGVTGLEQTAKVLLEECQKGDTPMYRRHEGWQGWPSDANERDVLGWFETLCNWIKETITGHKLMPETTRILIAQPSQPIQDSTAERKLDIGFIDESTTNKDSKFHWSQILVPGELKNNPKADIASKAWLDLGRYAREILSAQDSRRFVVGFTLCGSIMRVWQFDRSGSIASLQFNIHKDPLQLLSAILAFLYMDQEQLGYDPTIISMDGKRFIDIKRNGSTERLIIDKVIRRARCVSGRATTCWKAHREGDESRAPLVIKDSWQYPERQEEGELLREATEMDVVNVARYYHHETVQVGNTDDDIRSNVRNGLDVRKAANFRPASRKISDAKVMSIVPQV